MNKEFTYTLKDGFQYVREGDMVTAETITIQAPSNKVLSQVSEIEQEFEKAQMNMLSSFKTVVGDKEFSNILNGTDREKSDSKTSVFTAENVVKNLFSGGANINACFFALKEIMAAGNTEKPMCVVDGRVKFTKPLFDDMSPNDTKNILGEYIVNFIIASPQA